VLREEVLGIIKKYRFHPRVEYDQNFLINDDALFEILKEFNRRDIVFQIGLGLGTISYRLASRVKLLIVYEIDGRLIEIFRREFGKRTRRIKVVKADALEVKWPRFEKFFSSLPFSSSEPIIKRLEKMEFRKAVLIMPKTLFERAEKIFKLRFEKIRELKKGDFYPVPDTSAVLVRAFK